MPDNILAAIAALKIIILVSSSIARNASQLGLTMIFIMIVKQHYNDMVM